MGPNSLAHLTGELSELEALFDQLDDDNAAALVLAQFEQVGMEWTQKLERCVEYRRRQLGKQADLQAQIDDLQKLHDKAVWRQDRIERYMRHNLDARQVRRVECGPYTVRIQKNGGKPPVLVDELILPAEWWRNPPPKPQPATPDKERIREAILAGQEIPGASIAPAGGRLVIE